MIGCIIQARMGSTRLPGKAMLNVEDQKPVLYFVIKQIQECKLIDKIIVATTTNAEDDQIVDGNDEGKVSTATGEVVKGDGGASVH